MPLTNPIRGDTIEGLRGYVLEKEINSGHFGRVYQARELATNTRWACKVIEKTQLNKRQRDNVLNEVEIMRSLNHPNIISFKEFVDTPKYFIIIMDLMRGGDLFDRVIAEKTFLEEDARQMILQMADAIQYLHVNGVAHRDLKIENVMFNRPEDNTLKLGDFGLAKRIGANATRTPVGTQKYMAPEIVKGDPYSFSVDMWSIGCLMFILLYGTFPFYNETDKKGNRLVDITDKIKKGYFRFPEEGEYDNEPVSEAAQDLIKKCLVVDPTQRISIRDFLQHPWINTTSTKTTPLNAPAALRTSEGLVSMKEYFNVGVHAERGRLDGEQEIEDQLADQKSSIKLKAVNQSKILKKRQKDEKEEKA